MGSIPWANPKAKNRCGQKKPKAIRFEIKGFSFWLGGPLCMVKNLCEPYEQVALHRWCYIPFDKKELRPKKMTTIV